MDDRQLRQLLENVRTIAVVGASTDPSKPSHTVPAYLIEAGYTVIPVHPKATEILGQRAYPTLAEIPVAVDIVDVFRPGPEIPDIARQVIAMGAPVLWVQRGITSAEGKQIALEAGLTYLEDICIGETTRRLGTHPPGYEAPRG